MALDSSNLTGETEANMANTPVDAARWSTCLTVVPTIQEDAGSRYDVVNAWGVDVGAISP